MVPVAPEKLPCRVAPAELTSSVPPVTTEAVACGEGEVQLVTMLIELTNTCLPLAAAIVKVVAEVASVMVNDIVSQLETPKAFVALLAVTDAEVLDAVPALLTVKVRGPVFVLYPAASIVTVTVEVDVKAENAGVVIEPALLPDANLIADTSG